MSQNGVQFLYICKLNHNCLHTIGGWLILFLVVNGDESDAMMVSDYS